MQSFRPKLEVAFYWDSVSNHIGIEGDEKTDELNTTPLSQITQENTSGLGLLATQGLSQSTYP